MLTKKAPLVTTVSKVVLMFLISLGKDMERFEVKRGIIKSMGGNAGLAKLATEHFNDVHPALVELLVYSNFFLNSLN